MIVGSISQIGCALTQQSFKTTVSSTDATGVQRNIKPLHQLFIELNNLVILFTAGRP